MADERFQDLFDPRALAGDDGMTEMVIFAHHGKVIMRFARPMLFIAFDPKNMGEVLNRAIACCKEAGGEVVINLPKRRISQEKRDALITRATHVFRSMTEQRKAPAYVAQHVVDSILSAID